MRVYFLSSKPCALRVGGAYFGTVSDFERFAEISLKDNLFVECIPQGNLPVCFFLNEALVENPPKGVEIYLLKNGCAVYVRDFPPSDFSLQPITQKKFPNALVTLFRQGELQAAIETDAGVFVTPLPPAFSKNADIFYENGAFVIKTDAHACVLSGTGEILLNEKISAFSLSDGTLRLTLPLSDFRGTSANVCYRLSKNAAVKTEFSLLAPQNGKTEEELSEALLPYAFFESVLIGADYACFLSPALAEKSDDVRAFLGTFSAVVLTKNPKEIALVKQKRERVFELVYYQTEIQDGKITDIRG